MANVKISQLADAALPPLGTELVPVVQSGVTEKFTVDGLLTRLTDAPPAIGTTTPAAGSFTTLASSGNTTLGNATTDTLNVGVNGIVKDNIGNVGFGTSPVGSTAYIYVAPTEDVGTGGTSLHEILIAPTVSDTVTANLYGIRTAFTLDPSVYTLTNFVHYSARTASLGGATVTNQYGFVAESTLVGATTSIGFYGSLPAGSGRWNFYGAGTANNAYLGNSSFGKGSVPLSAVDTTSFGTGFVTNTGATYTVLSTDHTIVQTTAASVYTLPAASSFTGRRLHIVTQFAGRITSATSNVVPITGGSAGTQIVDAVDGGYSILQSDGTNWVIVAENDGSGVSSVKDFGAVGDGSTDDTAAINAAIAAVQAMSVRKLYFPVGDYRITAALTSLVGTGWEIAGDGMSATYITTTFNGDIFSSDASAADIYFHNYSNMTLQRVAGGTYSSSCGIRIKATTASVTGLQYANFTNIRFNNLYYGIYIEDTGKYTSGVFINNAKHGFFTFGNLISAFATDAMYECVVFEGGTGPHHTFIGGQIRGSNVAVRLGTAGGDAGIGDILFDGVHVVTADVAIDVYGPTGATTYDQNITIVGCQFDNCSTATVRMDKMQNFRVALNNSTTSVGLALTNCTNYITDDRNSLTVQALAVQGALSTSASATVGTSLGVGTTLTVDGNTTLGNAAADTLNVGANGIVKDALGNVGFGASPTGTTGYIHIAPTANVGTGGTTLHTILIAPTTTTSVTANLFGVRTSISLNASAHSLTDFYHYSSRLASIGGATVTNQYGFFAESSLVGATNNYGFYGAITAATGRWNFYAVGTANNAYAGLSSFGKVTVPTSSVDATSLGTNLVTNAAATYTVLSTDHTIVQTTAASVYTLPAASSFTGRRLHLLTQFAGTVTSASSNVVPIAGGAAGTAILAATAGKYAILQSNGTNWLIVAAN